MPRLIILEGPSGAGKTTFLKRFLQYHAFKANFPNRDTGYMTSHFGRCDLKTAEDVGSFYSDILETVRGAPLILDRYVMSNLVYAHTMGNQTSAGSHQTTEIFKRINFWYGDDYKTLVFTADTHVLDQRNVGRNREDFLATMNQTVDQFRKFAYLATGWMNAVHVNTSKADAAQTYSYCMEMLNADE